MPPLVYFRTAILHMQRQYAHFDEPARREPVLVVTDGGFNPALPELGRMAGVTIAANRSLEEDVASIVSAERLVWGFSTLRVLSLLRPTPYAEVWTWRFEWNPRAGKCGHCPSIQSVVFEALPPARAAAEVIVSYCHDSYLTRWTNQPAQRALVMGLNRSSLLFRTRDSARWQPISALGGGATDAPSACRGTSRNWEEGRARCGPTFQSRSKTFSCPGESPPRAAVDLLV